MPCRPASSTIGGLRDIQCNDPGMRQPDTSSSEPNNNEAISPFEEPAVKVPLAVEDWLSAILLGVLAVLTMANVLVRYLTNQSFAWTEEISTFLMIVMTLVAASAAVARQRHISI